MHGSNNQLFLIPERLLFKNRTYHRQFKLWSHTVILHAVSWCCVDQSCSFCHGHMIGRQQRHFLVKNCGMFADPTLKLGALEEKDRDISMVMFETDKTHPEDFCVSVCVCQHYLWRFLQSPALCQAVLPHWLCAQWPPRAAESCPPSSPPSTCKWKTKHLLKPSKNNITHYIWYHITVHICWSWWPLRDPSLILCKWWGTPVWKIHSKVYWS